MKLNVNTTLYNGRYIIESCIGSGGFGITYLAIDNNLQREVVIKEYFPQYMARRDVTVSNQVLTLSNEFSEEFQVGIRKFLAEARTLATLQGVNEIAAVYDFFQENNTGYIVMEYIRGKSLKQCIRERIVPYTYDEALKIIMPCLDALSRVHNGGIIHRDFTPDNIIIEDSGKIRIIDFGSSRDYINNPATMTVMVKHGYAPAEQYSNTVKQGASQGGIRCAESY